MFIEHFACPNCGFGNRVEWSDGETTRDVDCVNCRRDVPAAAVSDDGREPYTFCTCNPLNLDAHVEGARFTAVKFGGPASGIGVPDLTGVKAQHIKALRDAVDAFIASHYDPPTQQALMALMMEASITGNTTRLAYASQAIGWVKSVIAMFYPLRDQVLAASTAAEVLAVSFDAMATPSDPMVTIEQAMAL